MNDKTMRNILIVVAVVVVGLIALGFVGTLLTNIVPIAIAAVVGFFLGRASGSKSLLELARSVRVSLPAVKVETAEKPAAQPKTVEKPVEAAPSPQKAESPASAPAERLADPADIKPAVTIKTPEEIEAEVRLREQEITKNAPSADAVQAALEERRKRLLGDKPE